MFALGVLWLHVGGNMECRNHSEPPIVLDNEVNVMSALHQGLSRLDGAGTSLGLPFSL